MQWKGEKLQLWKRVICRTRPCWYPNLGLSASRWRSVSVTYKPLRSVMLEESLRGHDHQLSCIASCIWAIRGCLSLSPILGMDRRPTVLVFGTSSGTQPWEGMCCWDHLEYSRLNPVKTSINFQDSGRQIWRSTVLQLSKRSLKCKFLVGNYVAVQWLGLCAFTAEGLGSIPGWRAKIPQTTWHGQKKIFNKQTKK